MCDTDNVVDDAFESYIFDKALKKKTKKNSFGESCWDEKKGFLGKQHPLEQHRTANPAPQPQCCS